MIDEDQRTAVHTASNGEALKQRLRDFWNAHDPYWDTLSAEASVNSPNRERAATFIPEGGLVIDVGCGNAANSYVLRKRGRYLGMDASLLGLRKAVQPSLTLVCGDAESFPFRDEAFDVGFCTFVLEHMVRPVRVLREMHRVVRLGGRIVLLGPGWDFPFWYPNALFSKAQNPDWRFGYTLRRFGGQMAGWLFGALPFFTIEDPDVFHREFVHDADAVYVVWTYEVVRQMKRWGCWLVYWEVDDRLLGTHPGVHLLKRLLMMLPPYRRAGSTTLLVFEKG